MMEIFGWIMFLSVAVYMTACGLLVVLFGGLDLSPINKLWGLVIFVVLVCIWFFVWLTCPFSVQLNQ